MNKEDEVKNGNISLSARILSHLPSRLLQGSIFTQQGGSLLPTVRKMLTLYMSHFIKRALGMEPQEKKRKVIFQGVI